MRNLTKKASAFYGLLALVLVSIAGAQSEPGQKLSPVVKEFVKYDEAVIALTHVRVIDGTGQAMRADQTLIIRDGKIAAIGDTASTAIPAGIKVLDLTDHTVFPGIVGMHNHLFYPQPTNIQGRRVRGVLQFDQQSSFTFPRFYLAGGVTSLRTTASAEPYADLNLKKWIDDGRIPGPKIHVTSPYMEGKGNFRLQVHELTGPEDARKTAEFWADQGVTSFKAFTHITRAELKEVIDVAHKRGLTVTGHLCSITFREAVELGIDDIEHGFIADFGWDPGKKPDTCPTSVEGKDTVFLKLTPQSPRLLELFRSLIEHHVAVTSTLTALECCSSERPPLQQRALDVMSPQAQAGYLVQRVMRPPNTPFHCYPDRIPRVLEASFRDSAISAKSHCSWKRVLRRSRRFTSLRKMEARFLREDDRIGTLRVGEVADLVVVRGDPSTKISDVENVEVVFKDARSRRASLVIKRRVVRKLTGVIKSIALKPHFGPNFYWLTCNLEVIRPSKYVKRTLLPTVSICTMPPLTTKNDNGSANEYANQQID